MYEHGFTEGSKVLKKDFFPISASYGVIVGSDLCGRWFFTYTVVLTASAHKFFGRLWSSKADRTIVAIVMLKRSAVPFDLSE